MLGERSLCTWKLAVTSKDSAYTTHKITTVKPIISLLCLQDTTIYSSLPEKGLQRQGTIIQMSCLFVIFIGSWILPLRFLKLLRSPCVDKIKHYECYKINERSSEHIQDTWIPVLFLIHLIFCFPVSSSSEITLKPDDQKAYATNSFFSCVKEKVYPGKLNSDQSSLSLPCCTF